MYNRSMDSNHVNGTAYWTYNKEITDPVIIMIHGFRGTHHGLDLVAKKLNGYRVIVPDIPGFGETNPLEREHSLDNYVTWLRDFIDSLHLKQPPYLLGHSFGSIITSAYAAKYPKSVKKLILENPIGAPALEGPRAIMTQFAILYYWLGYKLPETAATYWLSSKSVVQIMSTIMTKTKDKKTRAYINDQHFKHFSDFKSRRVVSEAFKTSVSNNVRQNAALIPVPTLLIAGDRDDITTLSKQRELSKIFPDAELVVIENVGHLTHYETPNQVANAIRSFAR